MKNTISITILMLLTSTINALSMNVYETHKDLYSEKDLSRELNIPIFPQIGDINENQYFSTIFIETIKNDKILTMFKNFNKKNNTDGYILTEKNAYETAFPKSKCYPFYFKRFCKENNKHKQIWQCLKKALDAYKK